MVDLVCAPWRTCYVGHGVLSGHVFYLFSCCWRCAENAIELSSGQAACWCFAKSTCLVQRILQTRCVFSRFGFPTCSFLFLRTCGVAKMLFWKMLWFRRSLYSLQPQQGVRGQNSGLTKTPATFRVLDRPKIAEFVAACACSCANQGKDKAWPWIYRSDGYDIPWIYLCDGYDVSEARIEYTSENATR